MKGRGATLWYILGLMYRQDRRGTVLLLVLCVGQAGATGILALSLQQLVNNSLHGSVSVTVMFGVTAAAALAFSTVGREVQHNVWIELSQRVHLVMQREVLTLAAGLDTIEHLERDDYLDRQVTVREAWYSLSGAGWIFLDTLTPLVGLAVNMVLMVSVFAGSLVLMPLAVLPLWLASRGARLQQAAMMSSAWQVRAEEHLHTSCISAMPMKEIKIAQCEGELSDRAGQLWRAASAVRNRAGVVTALWSSLGWLVFAVGQTWVLLMVVWQALRGTGAVGDVVLVLAAVASIRKQLSDVVRGFGQLRSSFLAMDHYMWLKGYATSSDRPTGQARPPEVLATGIELSGVSFAYPGTSDLVLRDIDVFLPAGATVAVVGANGAGKTTLMKLLCGLYVPTAGSIRVDGVPLEECDIGAWRSSISATYQDFMRFQVTLQESVGVGRLRDIDNRHAVRRALSRVDADNRLTGRLRDLDTQLGVEFDGVELSTGQWQTVALARCAMRERPLLVILDEPTASLDMSAEENLFNDFLSRHSGPGSAGIRLVVSHRFATVRSADLILVLDNGTIVERGPHEQLLAQNGCYAEMYRKNLANYL